MARGILRRIAGVGAIFALGIASSPRVQLASASPEAAASVSSSHAMLSTATTVARVPSVMGRGLGAVLGCAACAVAGGMVLAGGPAAIIIAVNAPGSALTLMTCASACIEAFK
jgi:hypothetical protein